MFKSVKMKPNQISVLNTAHCMPFYYYMEHTFITSAPLYKIDGLVINLKKKIQWG